VTHFVLLSWTFWGSMLTEGQIPRKKLKNRSNKNFLLKVNFVFWFCFKPNIAFSTGKQIEKSIQTYSFYSNIGQKIEIKIELNILVHISIFRIQISKFFWDFLIKKTRTASLMELNRILQNRKTIMSFTKTT
jgi:hypothetical protein